MTTLGVALATGIYSGKANAEEKAKPKYDVFAGSLLYGPQDEVNSIFQIDDKSNGTRGIVETNNTPWTEKVNDVSVALRSPQIGRFQGEVSYDNSNVDNHSYTGITRAKVNDKLTVRVGTFENQDGNGYFVGGKASLEGLTLNGNVFTHNDKTDFNGYLAYLGKLNNDYQGFVSVGGSTNKDKIAAIAGIISDGKAGVYTQTNIDLENKEQSGRIIFAPKGWVRKAETYEFKEAVQTNAEMNGEFSDNTIISWAPYDTKSVSEGNNSVVVKWSNDKSTSKAELGFWNRAINGTLVGITPKVSYDKTSGKTTTSLMADIYYGIPGTPLEAALEVERNLTNGNSNSIIYFGYVGGFGK